MSEITPEKVAAAVADEGGGWISDLQAALSVIPEGAVLNLAVTRWDGPGDSEIVRHFRAVIVEGETVPIVLERPEELGISWPTGKDLLSLTADGIFLNPISADPWPVTPADARQMAAHLAAMADAWEAYVARGGHVRPGREEGARERLGAAEAAQAENGGPR